MVALNWPYIPPFEPEPTTKYNTVTAKAESVATSRLWRSAIRHRRCLIAADGFYKPDNTTVTKPKRQYYFRRRDKKPFFMAGVWGRWDGHNGEHIDSCTIITTDANSVVGSVHETMPAIIPPERYDIWLETTIIDPGAVLPLLRPAPADEWEGHFVGRYSKEDRHELILPKDDPVAPGA